MNQNYSFGVSNPAVSPYVQNPFPNVTLVGTEINAGTSQVIEVGGATWIVTNAVYVAALGGFQQVNPSLSSCALIVSGGIGTTLTTQSGEVIVTESGEPILASGSGSSVVQASAPANAPSPIAWTISAIGTTLTPGAALANIGTGNITPPYLASGAALANIGTGNITGTYLANATVTGTQIASGAVAGTQLATGAAIYNIGARGITTGYLAPANTLTQIGSFSIRDYPFGAVGNGTTDDSAAILAAAAAANAQAAGTNGSAVLYFPPGIYYYNSATPIVISPGVNVSANGALIVGGAATTDCFYFVQTGGNQNQGSFSNSWLNGIDTIPSVHNFPNGKGLRVNTSNRTIWFPTIDSCLRGVSLEVSQASSTLCLDNNIWGLAIQNCTSGVYNYADNNGSAYAQGNIVDVNFVVACKYSLHWAQGAGTSQAAFTINIYRLHAIDPASPAGVSYVFFQDTNGYSAGNVIICDSFLAPASTGGGAIWSSSMSTHFHEEYQLNFALSSTQSISGVGTPPPLSTVRPLAGNRTYGNIAGYALAGTTSGSRGTGALTFQYAQPSTSIFATVAAKSGGIAQGAYMDAWVYCDVLTGSSAVTASVVHSAPNVFIMAEDASLNAGIDGTGPTAGMIHLRIYNNSPTTIAASTTINMLVQVAS